MLDFLNSGPNNNILSSTRMDFVAKPVDNGNVNSTLSNMSNENELIDKNSNCSVKNNTSKCDNTPSVSNSSPEYIEVQSGQRETPVLNSSPEYIEVQSGQRETPVLNSSPEYIEIQSGQRETPHQVLDTSETKKFVESDVTDCLITPASVTSIITPPTDCLQTPFLRTRIDMTEETPENINSENILKSVSNNKSKSKTYDTSPIPTNISPIPVTIVTTPLTETPFTHTLEEHSEQMTVEETPKNISGKSQSSITRNILKFVGSNKSKSKTYDTSTDSISTSGRGFQNPNDTRLDMIFVKKVGLLLLSYYFVQTVNSR